METINIALFVYSIILLTTIYFYNNKLRPALTNDRIFSALLIMVTSLLVVDLMSRADGFKYSFYPFLSHIGNFMSFWISPTIPILWILYVHFNLYNDTQKTRLYMKRFGLIVILNTIMVIASQFGGYLYYIDEFNMYHRGPLYIWPYIINFILISVATLLLIIKRNRIEKGSFLAYLSFVIMPTLALVIQIIIPGIAYIPNVLVLSIVVLFIFIQNNQVRSDHLTGIFNRRQLDFYLEDRIKAVKKGKKFTGILIDIDDFKNINDTSGHATGDEALKQTARLLNSCIGNTNFLARYGGDEFIIITNDYEHVIIENMIIKIKDKFDDFNIKQSLYQLEVSIGYATYELDMDLNATNFISLIDKSLYENKQKN